MQTVSTNQLAWLADHDPLPCYSDLFSKTQHLFTLTLSASRAGLPSIATLSSSLLRRATNLLKQADDLAKQMNDQDMIGTAGALCAADPSVAG